MGRKGKGGRTRESERKKEEDGEVGDPRGKLIMVLGIVVVVVAFFFWPTRTPPIPSTSTPQTPIPPTPTPPPPPPAQKPKKKEEAPIGSHRVVRKLPHDPKAFTQGLFVDPRDPNYFFEGTGMYGDSELRRVEIATGKPTHSLSIPSSDFGEGITLFKNSLFQLTWRENKIYRYQLEKDGDFVERNPEVFRAPPQIREGWGITHNDNHLIISEGSYKLFFVDPNSLEVERTLIVRDGKKRVTYLNELEFIEGEIYANVWFTSLIYVISPETGFVLRKIELSGLKTTGDVYNGIAYWKDPQTSASHLYVTGKYWPNLYEIEEV